MPSRTSKYTHKTFYSSKLFQYSNFEFVFLSSNENGHYDSQHSINPTFILKLFQFFTKTYSIASNMFTIQNIISGQKNYELINFCIQLMKRENSLCVLSNQLLDSEIILSNSDMLLETFQHSGSTIELLLQQPLLVYCISVL